MVPRIAAAGLLHQTVVESLAAAEPPVELLVARGSWFWRQAAEKAAASDRT